MKLLRYKVDARESFFERGGRNSGCGRKHAMLKLKKKRFTLAGVVASNCLGMTQVKTVKS